MDSSDGYVSTGVYFLSFLPSAEGPQVFMRLGPLSFEDLYFILLSKLGPHWYVIQAYAFNFHEIRCSHPHLGTEMTSLSAPYVVGCSCPLFRADRSSRVLPSCRGLSFNVLPSRKAMSSARNGHESPRSRCWPLHPCMSLPGAPTLFQESAPFPLIFTVFISFKNCTLSSSCVCSGGAGELPSSALSAYLIVHLLTEA